jgi:hypothetical protein
LACEGENTEPLYFADLKEYIESMQIWNPRLKISISPIPKIDLNETNSIVPLKTQRRKRELKNTAVRINPVIEDIHKAEPIRFVREAQIGIENNVFDEAWAIFDDDNRKYIKEAFDLSQEPGKEVSIAYSSLCFEIWLLLHFERTITVFEKSTCRDGDTIIHCTSGNHEQDCNGTKCVLGYLRDKGYINGSSKGKISMFEITRDRLSIALHNSSWLKNYHLKNGYTKISDKKPYTDVDELVMRLLNIDDEIIWLDTGESYITNNLEISFMLEDNKAKIEITNKNAIIFIVREEFSAIENENYEIITIGKRTVLDPEQCCEISFNILEKDLNQPKFISFKIGKTKLISEI